MEGLTPPLHALHTMFEYRLKQILKAYSSLTEQEQNLIRLHSISSLREIYEPALSAYAKEKTDIYQIINGLQYRISNILSNSRIDSATVPFTRLLNLIKEPFDDFNVLMTQELIELDNGKFEVLTTLRHIPSGQEKKYITPVMVTNKSEFTSSVTKSKRTALRGILSI